MPYCRRSRSTCSSTVSVDSEDIGDQRNAAEPFEALCTKRPEARVARWKPRNDQSSGRASRCGCHTAASANSFDATWKMSWFGRSAGRRTSRILVSTPKIPQRNIACFSRHSPRCRLKRRSAARGVFCSRSYHTSAPLQQPSNYGAPVLSASRTLRSLAAASSATS